MKILKLSVVTAVVLALALASASSSAVESQSMEEPGAGPDRVDREERFEEGEGGLVRGVGGNGQRRGGARDPADRRLQALVRVVAAEQRLQLAVRFNASVFGNAQKDDPINRLLYCEVQIARCDARIP